MLKISFVGSPSTGTVNALGDHFPLGTVLNVEIGSYRSKAEFGAANPSWHICDADSVAQGQSPYFGQVFDMRDKIAYGWGEGAFNGVASTSSVGIVGTDETMLVSQHIPSLNVSGTTEMGAPDETRTDSVRLRGGTSY